MNVLSSISLLSLLLLTIDLSVVDAIFCQAVDGVYRERPNDPGALESPASVDLSYHYDLEISPDEPHLMLDPTNVAETLKQRLADALVFTLFDDCRVDPNDKMAQVNLLQIGVQVYAVADSSPATFEAQIQAIGDTAVDDRETALADMRLENAVRIVLTQHHVARFSVAEGAILTLRLPQEDVPELPVPKTGDNFGREPPPTSTTPPSHAVPILGIFGGCAALLAVVAILVQREWSSATSPIPIIHRQVHFTLPGEEDDDVELACSSAAICRSKPTSKLIEHHDCDPTEATETEISESSSSGEHEEEEW